MSQTFSGSGVLISITFLNMSINISGFIAVPSLIRGQLLGGGRISSVVHLSKLIKHDKGHKSEMKKKLRKHNNITNKIKDIEELSGVNETNVGVYAKNILVFL